MELGKVVAEAVPKYEGYFELEASPELITNILTGIVEIDLLENQYLVLKDEDNGKVVDIRRKKNGDLVPIQTFSITSKHFGKIKPRNLEQRMAFDLLGDKEVPLKFIVAGMGKGKTFLATNFAFDLLEKGHIQKIVYLRNNIITYGTEDIGYLKGTDIEKMKPWLGPLIDTVGSDMIVEEMIYNGTVEVVPLAFIRGRSFHDSVVICDECENLSQELYKLIIGRIGENSELWFLGDTEQTDLGRKKYKDIKDGTMNVIDKLKGNPLVGVIELKKTERSSLAELSNLL